MIVKFYLINFRRIGSISFLVFFISLCMINPLEATVIFTNSGVTINNGNPSASFDIDGDGTYDFRIFRSGNNMKVEPLNSAYIWAGPATPNGNPASSSAGQTIPVAGSWRPAGEIKRLCDGGSFGPLCVGTSKYLRFRLTISGEFHIAYVYITNSDNTSSTVANYAYESCLNEPIVAGATSGGASCPSTIPTLSQWGLIILGLLVLSAGAIAIRRRQMQVEGELA